MEFLRSSFGGETSGSIAKCQLFSQASDKPDISRVEGKVFTLGVWFATDKRINALSSYDERVVKI